MDKNQAVDEVMRGIESSANKQIKIQAARIFNSATLANAHDRRYWFAHTGKIGQVDESSSEYDWEQVLVINVHPPGDSGFDDELSRLQDREDPESIYQRLKKLENAPGIQAQIVSDRIRRGVPDGKYLAFNVQVCWNSDA